MEDGRDWWEGEVSFGRGPTNLIRAIIGLSAVYCSVMIRDSLLGSCKEEEFMIERRRELMSVDFAVRPGLDFAMGEQESLFGIRGLEEEVGRKGSLSSFVEAVFICLPE